MGNSQEHTHSKEEDDLLKRSGKKSKVSDGAHDPLRQDVEMRTEEIRLATFREKLIGNPSPPVGKDPDEWI